jgi:hypothetical protein
VEDSAITVMGKELGCNNKKSPTPIRVLEPDGQELINPASAEDTIDTIPQPDAEDKARNENAA